MHKPSEVFNGVSKSDHSDPDDVEDSLRVFRPRERFSRTSSECFSRTSVKPVAQVSPMHSKEGSSRGVRSRRSPIPLEESPPDFDAELDRMQTTMRLSGSSDGERRRSEAGSEKTSILSLCSSQLDTVGIKEASRVLLRRPATLGIRNYLHSGSLYEQRRNSSEEVTVDPALVKKVKVEVVDLDDEEDIKPTELSNLTASTSLLRTPPPVSEAFKTAQKSQEDEIVAKFQALNVVYIADALKQMRFAVGSCRRTIQGIVVDIVVPLRIVDDLWTMKVTIQDVSIDSFICIIDSSTLSSLIGLTPKEAMEIRASSDMNRRQDGQRRLAAVEEQLKRLDLLLDVELFSGGRADPVIRNIRTFMQALNVL
ncbi:hypothetical protein KIN20_034500 [Parelaphostrongylus tenuis]|uniref:RecQ-mediated genome instability protein 1 C-terminal OB-fold domain-containing protein n=1 Tax=Parelaphostrongylus tenuis TaxID=148309 RepID=A0AAD5RA88_PARTN|nr:hypothetical protein KIN20_034500 [Parelaphostrongylus tenuis]